MHTCRRMNVSTDHRATSRTQKRPIDVGSQRFASDLAFGDALDGRAMPGRYWLVSGDPLIDGAWRNAQLGSQFTLASDDLGGFQNWVHGETIARLQVRVNSPDIYSTSYDAP